MAAGKTQVKPGKAKKAFRVFYKTFFDVPRWIGVEQYKRTNKTLFAYLKDAFRKTDSSRNEQFDEAMQRMQLTEEDLRVTLKCHVRNFYIMAFVAMLLSIYGIYLLLEGAFSAALIDFVVILFVGVRVFQFNFWAYQIKTRRLGCTFRDWLSRT